VRGDVADLLNDLYRGKRVFWSRSYCIVACGGAPLSVINQYVEQQADRRKERFARSGLHHLAS
jgi:REP-associated tyrosine transposase